jgi:putative cardiolipin synthase
MTRLPKQGKAPLLRSLKTDKALAGRSAFYSLGYPSDALAARLYLIDHATSSLDVQYYIYKDDSIGNLISIHLIKAAERGVRVRILLDDINTAGKDEKLSYLAVHPNIELRLFNPNMLRDSLRNLALLLNINSLGKRMHNKTLIADGSAAIIGGRNIGDDYYVIDTETLFLDYDALIIGKVVPEIAKSFDIYWNSEEAVPASDILKKNHTKASYEEIKAYLLSELKIFEKSNLHHTVIRSKFNQKRSQNRLIMTVANSAEFYYDPPDKVSRDQNKNKHNISQQIKSDMKRIKKQAIVISPYFIPSDALMHEFKTLRDRNVEVIVVTNSLSSTDVFPVYGGYKGYIKPLLEMGVKIYELKGDSLKKLAKKKKIKNPPKVSLHTKMIILDDDELDIGSANIDPRSNKLNTELVMLIHSEKLVQEQLEDVEKILSLKYFYQLSWGEYPKDYDGEITNGPIWKTLENGKMKTYYMPPKASWWKMIGADIISLLPVKGYL